MSMPVVHMQANGNIVVPRASPRVSLFGRSPCLSQASSSGAHLLALSSCRSPSCVFLSRRQPHHRMSQTQIQTQARGGRDQGKLDAGDGFQERVVQVRRVTKVVKGGKQMSFRAVVVVGDDRGQVGVGCSSAKEVVQAVAKAVVAAKNELVKVPLTRNSTFPHRIDGYFGAAKVMLRPAAEGTGVIAGGAVRVVLELAGVKNAFGKQLGSSNPLNNARAALEGLSQMRTLQDVAAQRDLTIEELMNRARGTKSGSAAEETPDVELALQA